MPESSERPTQESRGSGSRAIWLGGTVVSAVTLIILNAVAPDWRIAFLAVEVILISIVIAQACDPFADAAQYIGDTLRLPGSVRGATLDAIASSMPELFCGLFFVLMALSATTAGDQSAVLAGAEGYGATIATCAGSAVYNMILIPAFCALVISWFRKERPTIEVEDEVIARDGVWFVTCELIMIMFLFQDSMHWWMGLIFLGLYVIYVMQLYADANRWRRRMDALKAVMDQHEGEIDMETALSLLRQSDRRISANFIARGLEQLRAADASSEDDNDSAGILFGYFEIPLNQTSAWGIVFACTLIAAGACYFLVDTTRDIAITLSIPTFFVAVIVAAAASSVPDTLLAIGAAMRGDDSGAVSNAFGSNIFDICICLSIPLLVNSYLTGWQPVSLLQDGEPIPGLVGLRILLVLLTVITLAIMWHNRELNRSKAIVLCGMYGIFICYAILGAMGLQIG